MRDFGGLSKVRIALWVAACTAGLMFASAPASAQSPKVTVHFDPAQTSIRWTLKATGHTAEGTFKLKGGVISFDPATGVAEGELLIDLASGESGNASRDEKMKKEVLEIDKYPQASFHATRVSGTLKPESSQEMETNGSFNIHGLDHQLQLKAKVTLEGNQATATCHFTVPYVAWGMKDPSILVLRVAKEVEVDVVAHGTIDGSAGK